MPDVSAGHVVLHLAPLRPPSPAPASSKVVAFQLSEMMTLPGLGETAQGERLTCQTSTEEDALAGDLPALLGDAARPQQPAVRERQPGAAQDIACQ